MVNAVHALLYAKDADKARAFLRDVLGWPHVDAGDGWLIFAMPPGEIGVHPTEADGAGAGRVELYLMCEDVKKTLAALRKKGVKVVRPVADQGWGLVTAIKVPGFGDLGLYQPLHPVAHTGAAAAAAKGKAKSTAKGKAKAKRRK